MVKVLYIAGWGRSGTTIVDNVFNSYKKVFSTGELFYLWQRGMLKRRKCGCGLLFQRCLLWLEILDVAFGTRLPDPEHVVDLQQQAIRVRHTPALAGGSLSPAAEEYLQIYTKLYHAIADVTGADLIVDSSKVPSGAAALTRMPGIEPYLLHMVRDPRAVAHSWMLALPPPKTRRGALVQQRAVASTMHWLVRNALTEHLGRMFPARHVRLRYEDFVANPRIVVEGVLSMTGTDPADGPFIDDHTVLLNPNHTIAGNPTRFRTGAIALRLDERWRDDQQLAPRLTSTALALPLLHHYGYRARPPQPAREPATV
jgi:hypothetical protein